jgi:preprotein translocase subunit YajC
MDSLGAFLPLIAVVGVFIAMVYFLMIRPIRQRERQHDYLVDHLEEGDNVITAGGLYGKIESIEEQSVVLRVESGASVRITKGAVVRLENEE